MNIGTSTPGAGGIPPTEGVPPWNSKGILPPVIPGESGSSPHRSPYPVDMHTFALQFGTSPERMEILNGLLQFRSGLYELNIIDGFQWLDGSFVENIELIETRSPEDIDVVTYFWLPPGETQQSLREKAEWLFDKAQCKKRYAVDSYFFDLGEPMDIERIKLISYWYSMWSHRRDHHWKGFVQVDLDPSTDAQVRASLNINEISSHE